MTQKKQNKKKKHSSKESYSYVYGCTVRKLDVLKELNSPKKEVSPAIKKNREKAKRMNPGYLLFLSVALFISAFLFTDYVQLKATLITKTKIVAEKEQYLNDLTISNNEHYNKIMSNIDIEEIKRIAMGELGMILADENHIITYQGNQTDYMRKTIHD